MKRNLVLLALGLACGIGTFAAMRYLSAQTAVADTRSPFFIKLYDRSSSAANSSAALYREHFYAIRSDGSYVRGRYYQRPDKTIGIRTREVVFISQRQKISLAEVHRAKTTWFLTEDQMITPRIRYDETCSQNSHDPRRFTVLGETTILAIKAYHLRENGRRAEYWRAPDLNCFDVQRRTEFTGAGGQVTDIFESGPIAIATGEPPSDLFVVPADFTEKSPSEVVQMDMNYFGPLMNPGGSVQPMPEDLKGKLDFKDKQYFASQANRAK